MEGFVAKETILQFLTEWKTLAESSSNPQDKIIFMSYMLPLCQTRSDLGEEVVASLFCSVCRVAILSCLRVLFLVDP
mgnify:CR=1 FL=1